MFFAICFLILMSSLMLPGVSARDDAHACSAIFFHNHPNALDSQETGNRLLLANHLIGLEFQKVKETIELHRLYDIRTRTDLLSASGPVPELLSINLGLDPALAKDNDQRDRTDHGILKNVLPRMARRTGVFSIEGSSAKSSAWKVEQNDQELKVTLFWRQLCIKDSPDVLQATATVTLRKGDPFSRWRIRVDNRSPRFGLERIRFPQLAFAPIGNVGSS